MSVIDEGIPIEGARVSRHPVGGYLVPRLALYASCSVITTEHSRPFPAGGGGGRCHPGGAFPWLRQLRGSTAGVCPVITDLREGLSPYTIACEADGHHARNGKMLVAL